ncbi:MAG: hypothetical protein EA408_10385 [Marinilabiliales bacterium]|nr:MAG: hypothetical protein EA408_10385 [Marinilabiliales bacterium]
MMRLPGCWAYRPELPGRPLAGPKRLSGHCTIKTSKTTAMKPFDERFADRVREVFDKHDEPVDPAAWEAMQSTLGQNASSTRRLMPWLLRIAAALLLIISFSVLLMLPEKDQIAEKTVSDTAFAEEDAAATSPAPAEHEALADAPAEPAEAGAPSAVAPDTPPSAEPIHEQAASSLADTPPDPAMADPGTIAAGVPDRDTPDAVPGTPEPRTAQAVIIPPGIPDDHTPGTPEPRTAHAVTMPPALSDDTATVITPTVPVAAAERTGAVIPSALAEAATVATEDPGREPPVDSLRHEPDVPVIADAGQLFQEMPLYGTPVDEPAGHRALRWGVAAGPMLTYAEQQLASGMGFSAGASSEYRLSRQFTVKSGLLLAYQQFEVDNMPLRSRSSSKYYSSMPEDAGYQLHRSYSNQAFEIMAVDIPVNIQYQLMETTRRQMYVEAGFSSLLYLQQKITGEEIAYVEQAYYSPADGSYRQLSSRVVSDVTASYGPFSRFDPARLLNLSFGYTISGGNYTTIIEPFIKYPLGDLGSRQIRMGMGGINLRLRFGE